MKKADQRTYFGVIIYLILFIGIGLTMDKGFGIQEPSAYALVYSLLGMYSDKFFGE